LLLNRRYLLGPQDPSQLGGSNLAALVTPPDTPHDVTVLTHARRVASLHSPQSYSALPPVRTRAAYQTGASRPFLAQQRAAAQYRQRKRQYEQ